MINTPEKVALCVIGWFGAKSFTRPELLAAMKSQYPDVAESSILPADFCVNKKSSGQQLNTIGPNKLFLYAISDGKYRIYHPGQDNETRV